MRAPARGGDGAFIAAAGAGRQDRPLAMMPPSPRAFDVESPLRAKVLLLAVVVPLGLALTRLAAGIADPTIAAILPFAAMITAVAAFLWPRRLIVGADGVALEGFVSRYESWDRVASVRLERGRKGRARIVLAREGGRAWRLEPHWEAEVPLLVAEMEAKRAAFRGGGREPAPADDAVAYRVASVEPHVRVLVDPRNALEDRVAAGRRVASVDRARADQVLDELLAETADPRARRAFVRM
jgi:hypothetical protein